MDSTIRYLEGRHAALRPLEEADTRTLYEMVNNDRAGRRLTGTQVPFTLAEIEAYIARQAADPTRTTFGIVRLADGRLVGEVVLMDIHPHNHSAGLRINIADEATGQGVGTEALRLMLEYAFGTRNLHRVELEVYDFNARALHVYEKLGFRREGVRRQCLFSDHAYHDAVLMGLLAEEYRAGRGT